MSRGLGDVYKRQVIEAMKMQSNYKVNSECVVKEIFVNEGDSVNSNQVIMTLDVIKEED